MSGRTLEGVDQERSTQEPVLSRDATARVAPDVICCRKVKIGRSAGFITMGGPVYRIKGEDSERNYTFEWHPMWGPSRCHSVTGELLKNPFFPERSPFWKLFGRWTAGGKKVDEFGRCILGPPPKPCGPCGGVGYFKFDGDRRKHACPECSGEGVSYPPLTLKPRAPIETSRVEPAPAVDPSWSTPAVIRGLL